MKLALCFAGAGVDAAAAARRMAEAQRLFDTHQVETFPVDGGALACVRATERFSAVPLLRRSEGGNLLLVSGVPLDLESSLDARLEGAVAGDWKSAASRLGGLDGAFAAVFWDAQACKLLVVTDFLGMQPLFMVRRDGVLTMASELKAFCASGLMPAEMDPAGWGSFISLGYTTGSATQLAGVRRVDGAVALIYDAATGETEQSTYWRWPELRNDLTLKTTDTGALIDALKQEVRAYGQHTTASTLLLSGGFDSRIALAVLCDEDLAPEALSLAHQDELWSADGRLAAQVARRLGLPHRLVHVDRDYYSTEKYLQYLVMNEVSTPSLYLFIAQVWAYLEENMRAVWECTPPGYAFVPAFLPKGGFDVFLEHSCVPREGFAWGVAEAAFGRHRADEFYDAFRELLRAELADYPDDELGVTQFEVLNRMRNRTLPNALRVYSNVVFPFVPGVSRAFWDLAGAIPYAVSRDYRMYLEVFHRHFPPVDDVLFLSSGTPYCGRSMGLRSRCEAAMYSAADSKPGRFVRKAYRRLVRKRRKYWSRSLFLDEVRRHLELDHPDLDADGVRALDHDRRLPFYWQVWRWVMEGHLTTWNADTFFAVSEGAAPDGETGIPCG